MSARPQDAARLRRAAADTETGIDLARRLAPGTMLSGRYRVESVLGIGGMGVVYRAHDQELGQEIAVKVLRPDMGSDPEWVDRFRREIVLAREVSHRNVVRIHDIHESDGLRFLTMRLVEGRSLQGVLDAETRVSAERAAHVTRQVADALQQAHAAGIVHRDLKPANILLEADDTAYVTDFGIARALGESGLTRAGVVVGTPDYLAPEQVAGEPVDGRADLYALGIVLFEMLTGELPFRPGSPTEMMAQRLTGRVRDTRETGVVVPPALSRVLRKLLERSPARRYQAAAQVVHDLDHPEAGSPRWALPAAAVALLVLVAGAGAWAWRHRTPVVAPPPVAAAPVAARHAVAVLPLADETADPALAWTGTGVAEMIATRLSRESELRVVDSVRVLRTVADLKMGDGRYDDRALRQLADMLGVDTVVAGTVRRAGHAVRVETRAVAVQAGATRVAGSHAEDAPEVAALFGAVDRLGEALAATLGATRTAADLPPDEGTTSATATAAYEDGRRRLAIGDPVGAQPALAQAVAADPRFAAALLALSEAQQELGYEDRALQAAQQASAVLGDSRSRLARRVRARQLLLRGQPAEAEAISLDLARALPNDPQPLIDVAAAQSAHGDVARAVTTLQQAAALDRADPRVWYLLGKNAIMAGDSRRALNDYLLQALTLQNQLGNVQGQAEALNAMGAASQQLGDPAGAEKSLTQAIALREKSGDERALAASLLNRARAFNDSGQADKAAADLARAAQISGKIGDRAGQADAQNDAGVLAESRGDFAKALASYQSALRLRRDLGDERQLAQSYDNVGYIYFLQGEYDHALVYWQQALELHRQGGEAGGLLASTQNMGFLQLAQGRWPEAMKSFVSALDTARQTGSRTGEAVSHGNIGVLQHLDGHPDAALKSFDDALAILGALGDPNGQTEFTLKRAATLMELGARDAAHQALEATTPWLAQTGNAEQAADRAALLGEWQALGDDVAGARRSFAEAEKSARDSHSRPAQLRVRVARALALAGPSGDLADAQATARDADALGDALMRLRAAEAVMIDATGRRQAALAEETSRRAIALAEKCGWHAGLWRLRGLLAQALAMRGDAAGAAQQRAQAAQELQAVRDRLPEDLRRGLDALPAAHALAGH